METGKIQKFHKVELLSPAGNPEGFYGAIHAGADAVYLAGNRFGARAYAENFTTEKLVECIRYAHLCGRKIYLTVNTLLKNEELAELYEYLQPFYEAGLDAVIVQDLGVLRFVRENFPGLEIHVSTQMTLCSSYGASLLKSMGASRIVPARELSLQELISIKSQEDIELETFIHGAMCYCYSGQCLFSSMLGGRSGNRGRCAQPCRLPYTVNAGNVKRESCYPLSLKDMCTIEYLPQLIEAGIDSFKIEGRMKKPEYTAGVTAIYRYYIDKYYELREQYGAQKAAERYCVSKKDMADLSSLYIRSEIQNGYYFKHNGREMVTMTNPAYSGSNEALLEVNYNKYIKEPLKLPITVYADFSVGRPASVTMNFGEISAHVTGDIVAQAQKQPITEENIRKQLNKLGDSAFFAKDITIFVDNAFYPLKQINELRRAAVEKLEQEILLARGYRERKSTLQTSELPAKLPDEPTAKLPTAQVNPGKVHGFSISVNNLTQLRAIANWFDLHAAKMHENILRIYIDGDLLVQHWNETLSICSTLPASFEIWAALPYILRERDQNYLETLYNKAVESGKIKGFLVRSMDGFGFLRKIGNQLPCRADAGVYVWNASAVGEIDSEVNVQGFCMPYELKASEQRELLETINCGNSAFEKIVYSRIPMMITANCLQRTADKCQKDSDTKISLTDRYRKNFPVLRNCLHCMNIIYNSVPFSLHQETEKWKSRTDLRLDFTIESAKTVRQVFDTFLLGLPFAQKEYTTGHEKRGVE